ncbi:dipeptidyl-peptidase 3 family protein [Qipengyuania flava]|uniref:dipeptidyl-peptidase 3 family protein n=1 Tax=Qipengyuania flava TaxID=192812 RepID=UPI001CFEA300|nr:hypothetical protein [Qipengyuania flava]
MRRAILPLLLASAACIGCAPTTGETGVRSTAAPADAAADDYDLRAQYAKLATIEMTPDTSFLTEEEREVVNLLIEASGYMDEIYLRQRGVQLPQLRETISRSRRADRDLLVAMFDRNFGPWDEVAELRPFWGTQPMPEGAGFYPADLTREEFDAYLAANPDQREALTNPYTVVERRGDGFVAVPYSQAYREWLVPAARLLEQAAERTSNPSLKRFLSLRAKSFLSDDYFESEMAWMDLQDTPIEVAIGPYEVYTDRLYGTKTAFESFVTLRNPEESAALAKYKNYLRTMEESLPIPDEHKNFQRGFESPIAVADQVHGGGDNVPGTQTIAFNLPNDERVREAKGAKKVILANVLGAKYDRILAPMADVVLKDDQAALVAKKYMEANTLFHELSHSLGPGTITVGGRQTTVNAELRDQYSALEESKADVMGIWNILLMMEKGEIPASEKPQLFSTYFTGLFRSMRFGTESAHGRGAKLQYGYLQQKGAFAWDDAAQRYTVDYAAMEAAIRDLLNAQLMLQATGDYAGTIAFFDRYAVLDAAAQSRFAAMDDIPVDIAPVYPDGV